MNSVKSAPEIKLATPKTVEAALGELRKLPLMPFAAQQAMSLAANDDANLAEFTRLLERDVTLAISILKLANSPFFSYGRNIDSVEQAVLRLGIQECRNLLVAVSMKNLYQQASPAAKAYCAILWKHCFLTACLTRRLSQELQFEFHGEEFTAGLLHDLGRILLAISMPDQLRQIDRLDFNEGEDLLERERAILGTDHCEFGQQYAQHNKLPFSVIAAIAYHHNYQATREHHDLVSLVITADHMANHLQREEAIEAYDIGANPGFAKLSQKWSKERTAWFANRVPMVLQDGANADENESGTKKPKPGANSRPRVPQKTPRPVAKAPEPKKGVWDRVTSWF